MPESTFICPTCGWVYPAGIPLNKCRFCGTVFAAGICDTCGKYGTYIKSSPTCIACESKRRGCYANPYNPVLHKANRGREAEKTAKSFADWKKLIEMVPTPIHTLTEQEWIEACSYFKGCALCGEPSIDARGMLISFKEGGRYANWNVIPLCERCSTSIRKCTNPFKSHSSKIGTRCMFNNEPAEKFDKAVEYLQVRLKEAANVKEL